MILGVGMWVILGLVLAIIFAFSPLILIGYDVISKVVRRYGGGD